MSKARQSGANLAAKDDLDASHRGTKADLAIAVRDLKIWTGSIAAAAVAMLVTLLHLWPPHP